MILKDADDRTLDIAALKQLLDAAPRHHRARIQKQINNIYSGASGERDAAHFLAREFGSSDRTAILNDLRLEYDGEAAQIDHLVIHRVQATAWVLETKNYAGRLTCDEHGDWTVWNKGKPHPIPSPVNQARRQCELLRRWLNGHQITALSKIEPVVLISPTSSVDRSKLAPGSHVVKSDNFGEWWNKQTNEIGVTTILRMVGKHVLAGMSEADLVALGQRLIDAHKPAQRNWRAVLRMPEAGTEGVEASGQTAQEPMVPTDAVLTLSGTGPWVVATELGAVTISRMPSGAYALRNERNDALIEVVKRVCRGRGRWNPRFRNWLIGADEIGHVLAELNRSQS